MERREFIRAAVGVTVGTLPAVHSLVQAQGTQQKERVISTDEFLLPVKIPGIRDVLDGDALVLVGPERRLRLNETGRFIWQYIDGKTCTEQLATRLAAEYGVEVKDAAVDVDFFLTGLKKQGFLRMEDYSQRVTIERSILK